MLRSGTVVELCEGNQTRWRSTCSKKVSYNQRQTFDPLKLFSMNCKKFGNLSQMKCETLTEKAATHTEDWTSDFS